MTKTLTTIYECANEMVRSLSMLRQAAIKLNQHEIADDVTGAAVRLTTPAGREGARHLLVAHDWRGDRWTPEQTGLAHAAYDAREALREAIEDLRGLCGERYTARDRAEWRTRCLDNVARSVAALAPHVATPDSI